MAISESIRQARQIETERAEFIESHLLPGGRGYVGLRKCADESLEVVMSLDGKSEQIFLCDGKMSRRAFNVLMDAHLGACRVLHMLDAAAKRQAA